MVCQQPNFESANEFLPVPRMNPRGGGRIETCQNAMQRTGTGCFARVEAYAKSFVAPRKLRQAVEQSPQVKSSATYDNRQMAASRNVLNDAAGVAGIIACRVNIGGREYVDHVVWDAAPF